MNNLWRGLIALSSVCFSRYTSVEAQSSQLEWESLAAIPGVRVEIEGITQAAERDGLSADSVRRQVEAMLGTAGIRVFSQAEWQETIGNPGLHLRFQLISASNFFYIYHISIEVRQLSFLVRDTTRFVHARTWSGGENLGTLPRGRIASLHDQVRNLVRGFIRDYLRLRRTAPEPPDQEIGHLPSNWKKLRWPVYFSG